MQKVEWLIIVQLLFNGFNWNKKQFIDYWECRQQLPFTGTRVR